jgi:hypothetical protein
MSDENIVKNITDKKFTKANIQFADMMKNKVYRAVADFKKEFKYVTHDVKPETKDNADG